MNSFAENILQKLEKLEKEEKALKAFMLDDMIHALDTIQSLTARLQSDEHLTEHERKNLTILIQNKALAMQKEIYRIIDSTAL